MPAHFQLPLDLPHAGKVARRLVQVLGNRGWLDREDGKPLMDAAMRLTRLLAPYFETGENPSCADLATAERDSAAALGREIVSLIRAAGAQDDRVGQCIRNLFECLELGEEGARLSIDAGENPDSPQRP